MVNTSISSGNNFHQAEWTKSIAVGSENFVSEIKNKLGIYANGRRISGDEDNFHLREPSESYNAVFDSKKGNIEAKNTYLWDTKSC